MHGAAGRGMMRHGSARAAGPLSQRAARLAEKIRQLADHLLDKHATVQSVAEHVGPWKNDDGSSECEVTPRDRDFRSGYIGIDSEHSHPHLPVGTQRIEYLDLTLAKDAALTADALERVFGKWDTVPPSPHGNPYSVVFYYPNDKASLSVAVFAKLSGPPEEATTRVTSVMFRRDDAVEATHKN